MEACYPPHHLQDIVSSQVQICNAFVRHCICLRLCRIPHLLGGAIAVVLLTIISGVCVSCANKDLLPKQKL